MSESLTQSEDLSRTADSSDAVSHRTLQNRINQRASRRRRLINEKIIGIPPRQRGRPKKQQPQSSSDKTVVLERPTLANTSVEHWSLCTINSHQTMALVGSIVDRLSYGVVSGCPTSDLLLSLTQLNTLRGLLKNLSTLNLSMDDIKSQDRISPFVVQGVEYLQENQLPLGLLPTALQTSRTHHPWIDPIPFPEFRDALLQYEGYYDDIELCSDLVGLCGPSSSGEVGMIIWGQPGDPGAWEVSEKFARKWFWLFKDCHKLLLATNHWRSLRGENKLFDV